MLTVTLGPLLSGERSYAIPAIYGLLEEAGYFHCVFHAIRPPANAVLRAILAAIRRLKAPRHALCRDPDPWHKAQRVSPISMQTTFFELFSAAAGAGIIAADVDPRCNIEFLPGMMC